MGRGRGGCKRSPERNADSPEPELHHRIDARVFHSSSPFRAFTSLISPNLTARARFFFFFSSLFLFIFFLLANNPAPHPVVFLMSAFAAAPLSAVRRRGSSFSRRARTRDSLFLFSAPLFVALSPSHPSPDGHRTERARVHPARPPQPPPTPR